MTIRRSVRAAALFVAASLLVVGAGCGDDGPPQRGARLEGSITVSAAASLTAAFDEIGDAFEAEHPGVTVTFNYDASSALVTQIESGAPADVFASADEANMAKLSAAGLVAGAPDVFARNELVIVTQPGNPAGISSLSDLVGAGVVALCGAEVPCGKYAQQALDGAGVAIPETSVTRGQNAGATLAAVGHGDAVAGIVYVTDADGAGDTVERIAIPPERNVTATYPVAALGASAAPDVAAAFVDMVLGAEGRRILTEHGFLPPA